MVRRVPLRRSVVACAQRLCGGSASRRHRRGCAPAGCSALCFAIGGSSMRGPHAMIVGGDGGFKSGTGDVMDHETSTRHGMGLMTCRSCYSVRSTHAIYHFMHDTHLGYYIHVYALRTYLVFGMRRRTYNTCIIRHVTWRMWHRNHAMPDIKCQCLLL